MSRAVPPVLAVVLVAMWLVLNDTMAPAQVVAAVVLAAALAWWGSKLRPLRPRLHRPWLAPALLATVFVDIVRSNIAVGRIILGLVRDRDIRSGLLEIPLDLTDPHGLAVLATIITSTPGTVWVGLSPDRRRLTLHVLDLRDEAAWIRTIKERYERPLIGIFEP
ncbi:MAG: Na(+)/H(+) antiporter subunit E1 [Steroidobacteraceae bacterium]|nr:Na(+)/H(+) antiporter subunit E1 [Steroidobacteraceae bacterium]